MEREIVMNDYRFPFTLQYGFSRLAHAVGGVLLYMLNSVGTVLLVFSERTREIPCVALSLLGYKQWRRRVPVF